MVVMLLTEVTSGHGRVLAVIRVQSGQAFETKRVNADFCARTREDHYRRRCPRQAGLRADPFECVGERERNHNVSEVQRHKNKQCRDQFSRRTYRRRDSSVN